MSRELWADELAHALEVLRKGKRTHEEWIDYLTNENPDFDTEHVGDVAHHEWYLSGYAPAIAILEKVIEFDAIWRRYYDTANRRFEAGLTYDELWFVVTGEKKEEGPS